MELRVREPGEVVAVLPHLIGFTPHDSVVCLPTRGDGPAARVDHPHGDEDFESVVDVLVGAYRGVDAGVVLVCVTDRHFDALRIWRLMRQELGERLAIGLRTHERQWVDLATGTRGTVAAETRERFAAEAVLAGRREPFASRAALVAEIQPDPQAAAAVARKLRPLLERAAADLMRTGPGHDSWTRERLWLRHTIDSFAVAQTPFDDATAARVLLDVQERRLRDEALIAVARETAPLHSALWGDLTRRCPRELLGQCASVLALVSWLGGNGARSWAAVDLVPDDQECPLATLTSGLLVNAVPPTAWDAVSKKVLAPSRPGVALPPDPSCGPGATPFRDPRER